MIHINKSELDLQITEIDTGETLLRVRLGAN